MTSPNKNFRENADRAIYVSGEINQALVASLTPTINKLRLESNEPITAYIDSRGGSVQHATIIRQLAKAPHPDGGSCRLITVVTGNAASAAADFLALGDYAIAFPHSSIMYHGTRQTAPSALTYEVASTLAQSLQRSNEFFAVELARRVFPRFILRVSEFKDWFQKYKVEPGNASLKPLALAIKDNFSSANGQLLADGFSKQETIASLNQSVNKHLRRFKDFKKLSPALFELEILKAIIKYKLKVHAKDIWALSGGGLQEVANDFELLADFYFGSQTREVSQFLDIYGPLFLSESEQTEYQGLPTPEAKAEWLKPRAEFRIQPLWYLAVSICRLLQTADYVLSPIEAYWLGLVDEVPGSGLVNLRQMAEAVT